MKFEHYMLFLILIVVLLSLLMANDLTGKQIVEIKEPAYVFCNQGQLIGDANNDGVVTPSDADVIIDASFGMLRTISTCCLDVNKDGRVTSQDAQEVINMLYKGQQSKERC